MFSDAHVTAMAVSGTLVSRGALVVGVLALVGAVAWRWFEQMRVRAQVRSALTSADPAQRRAAVVEATEVGLGATAPLLLRLVEDEIDEDVLAALVHAVARRQWEPASTGRIVELRMWAKAYADRHPELHATIGGPPPAHHAPASHVRRSSDAGTTPIVPRPSQSPERDATDELVHVLVTGAGGPAGVAVVRDLVAAGHHVTAVDADPSAVGLRLAARGFVVPRGDDPAFVPTLLDIAARVQAEALICTVAEEYDALVPAEQLFANAGVATAMPSRESVRTCLDKWSFARAMTQAGLPAPETTLGEVPDGPGPWFVKPRFGRGSRGAELVTRRARLSQLLRSAGGGDLLVQTPLTGREFTADTLVGVDGEVVAVVPRWRLETRGGISTKGSTFVDAEVERVVRLVLEAVGLVGPANVQGFVDADGRVTVIEVNPRFSGGLPLSLHAGADLVGEYLRMVLGRPLRRERLVARPDVVMMRHFAEVFEG